MAWTRHASVWYAMAKSPADPELSTATTARLHRGPSCQFRPSSASYLLLWGGPSHGQGAPAPLWGRCMFGAGRLHIGEYPARRKRTQQTSLSGSSSLRLLQQRHGSMDLPSADSIVRLHAELLLIISLCQKRNRGGRYNKHDTARPRYIKGTGLRWLRFGKLVPDNDMHMMRFEPQSELHGADLAAMDSWSKKHAPDPRSSAQGASAEMTEEQQTTLLRWAARRSDEFAAPLSARRGAPASYVLHFGAYKGQTLAALVKASRVGGRKSLLDSLPLSSRASETPEPGDYLLWMASPTFTWSFPYHLDLYFALRQLDVDSCCVGTSAQGGPACGRLR